ncbi:hypothetical protein [Cellulomonas sp.]|uniref:hypothetical protein n=1 Tax=Cellulomonas sp. TaxID=40001 RepID=UPI002810F39A|nr:hypothetical protein [Cellulomonas sp.]
MTLTDDQVAAVLRARADRDAPPMTLDAVRTLARGRRRRRVAAGTTATALGLTAVGVALGTAALLPTSTVDASPASPAGTTQAPAARPEVADLAEGLRAARAPVPRRLADGTTWWDTGIGSSATGETVVVGTRDGVPAFGVADATGRVPYAMSTWSPDAALADHGPADGYDGLTGFAVGTRAAPVEVETGAVPAWMPGARVAHVLPSGVVDPTGTVRYLVEVPTFDDPSGSGSRLYVLAGTDLPDMDPPGPEDGNVAWTPSFTVFVGTDGSAYVNGVPVTPAQLALLTGGRSVDEVLTGLVALGARL